jgi:RNA polymerase sigma factor for flagellar operon FliA
MQSFTYGRQSIPYPTRTPEPAPFSGEVGPADREQVLLENLPMVRFVARRIHEKLPQHVQLEDLVSAGILGLIDATAKFDPAKNTQFRTYAQFRIRGAILDSLRDVDWGPRDLRRKGRAIEDAIRTLTVQLGRAPAEAEIAQELGQSLEEYHRTLSDLNGLEIGSLHAQRNEDSGEEELAYVPGPPGDDPLFLCMRAEMRSRLQLAIEELPENERLVLTLYYYEELTMKEIAMVLNVTASRVSQIRSSAILHMRSKLEKIAAPANKARVEQEKSSQ